MVYINLGDFPMLKLFHVLGLPKSGIVVLQLLCMWLCILSLPCDVMSYL
jgi:hypothetical protein